MAIPLTRFDAAEYLNEPEDQAELLAAAADSADAEIIAKAAAIVDRARSLKTAYLSPGRLPRAPRPK